MNRTAPRWKPSLVPSRRTQALRLVHVDKVGNVLVFVPFGGGGSPNATTASTAPATNMPTTTAPATKALAFRNIALSGPPYDPIAPARRVAPHDESSRNGQPIGSRRGCPLIWRVVGVSSVEFFQRARRNVLCVLLRVGRSERSNPL